MGTDDPAQLLANRADAYYEAYRATPSLFRAMKKAARAAYDAGVPLQDIADICRVSLGEAQTWIKRPN